MKNIKKNPLERKQGGTVKTLCVISMFCVFSSVLYAQTDGTWNYPVKPGSEQWRNFKSVDEMHHACQIPEIILKQIDTESLVDICLNYPAPPLFPLFNTPQQAFMEYYASFNGIRELFQREDAGRSLLKRYAMLSFAEFDPAWALHQQGRFINHYKFVESILSQPQIIASLGVEGRKALLQEAIKKIDEKISKTDLFSGFSLEINLWVIGCILYHENKLAEGYDKENLQTAINTGMFVGIDVNMLYQQSKIYANENE